LVGILNGVDYGEWDPRVDARIVSRYSHDDLTGKGRCKRTLLERFDLPSEPELPLVGIVSRLVAQKGLDVVVEAWRDLLERSFRLVVLGTGEPSVEAGFRSLAARAPDRCSVRLGYDEGLAHEIQAGSDMLLMPSRFEPCGLPQLFALRYGTVPIVHATGGLADTVEPYDAAADSGTGFGFERLDAAGLIGALDEALGAYRDRKAWRRLMLRGMARDFSWGRSASAYVKLYRRVISGA
jgi:starch synthase